MKIKRGDEQKDHPRRCGENLTVFQLCPKSPGSPPQVRGKPENPGAVDWNTRITPAGAGKTFWKVNGYGNLEDHPRRCGENRGR